MNQRGPPARVSARSSCPTVTKAPIGLSGCDYGHLLGYWPRPGAFHVWRPRAWLASSSRPSSVRPLDGSPRRQMAGPGRPRAHWCAAIIKLGTSGGQSATARPNEISSSPVQLAFGSAPMMTIKLSASRLAAASSIRMRAAQMLDTAAQCAAFGLAHERLHYGDRSTMIHGPQQERQIFASGGGGTNFLWPMVTGLGLESKQPGASEKAESLSPVHPGSGASGVIGWTRFR